MRIGFPAFALFSLGMVGACASIAITGDPAVPVYAVAETVPVGTTHDDAADDPAIWRNPDDPSKSLILGTDKKAGLYVYALDGQVRHFDAGGALNNVDLVDMGEAGVIAFASDRGDPDNARIRLYRLDIGAGRLVPLGTVPAGSGEAYGICGWRREGALIVYSVLKEGWIGEYEIFLDSEPSARLLRSLNVPTQPEGCEIDMRNGTLYIGEENAGIWRFAAGATEGVIVAPIDNRTLVADVEGLALVPEGEDGGWLYASSQGDNAFMRFSLPDMAPAGRFRIAEGQFGSAEETDGIEAKKGDFGPDFPGGLFVAQDGVHGNGRQNFKLVPLAAIEAALEGE